MKSSCSVEPIGGTGCYVGVSSGLQPPPQNTWFTLNRSTPMALVRNRWLRRALLAAGAGLVVGATFLMPHSGQAQGGGGQGDASTRSEAAKLPISTVVLFSSGVGYFQRDGEVTG